MSRMVVHEWGTFTTLQDFQGRQLMGINIDDEPVPDFVHNLEPFILNTPILSHDYWLSRQKGAPRRHPQVSMRLETPVIYFYPPQGMKTPTVVDVDVKLRGGWLTEFYPNARVTVPGADRKEFDFSGLSPSSIGELRWSNLQVGTEGRGPTTQEHVWLAPRRVAAVNITNEDRESEKYLFYRGVAQQESALRVVTSRGNNTIRIEPTFTSLLKANERAVVPQVWLMEARSDGTCAYRALGSLEVIGCQSPTASIEAKRGFEASEFAAENRGRLEQDMHQALTSQGLYADEATAMLSTWQRAYFTSSGLRVFYLVPRLWTDHVLPLSISGDPEIARVMIGRVELISDLQFENLQKLAHADGIGSQWIDRLDWKHPARKQLQEGRGDLGKLGVEIPPHFERYLELGRFRNALLLWGEQEICKQRGLTQFIDSYELRPFDPAGHQ
jgi:hypothetical protein